MSITVKDLIEYGYKEYKNNSIVNSKADKFFQKKIVLANGDEVFIDAYIYDFSKFDPRESVRFSFCGQFNSEFPDTTFNIETVGWKNEKETLLQVEAFFLDMYEFSIRHRELKNKR